MLTQQAAARKRAPVDWRRYSTHARRARGRLPRFEHPLLVSLAVSLIFALAGLSLLRLAGLGVGAGLRDLGSSIEGSLPKPQEEELVIGETTVNVSAAPILEGLPEFSKGNEILLAGKVPAFAVKPDRVIALAVNGRQVGTFGLESDGRFGGTSIVVPDGTSTIVATLFEATTQVASTSHTVTVDRTPPQLSIIRPKAGDTIDGPDVIVEGKTEAAADVTVNDRALRPNPDGTFTERIVAQPGPLTLTVVTKDKAGNETKTEVAITVKPASQVSIAGTTLAVALDRAKVRPGETVVATIAAAENGKPRAGLAVTIQVGVFTIGTYTTDRAGTTSVGFAAPDHEVEDVAVVVLGGGASARATLTVAKQTQ